MKTIQEYEATIKIEDLFNNKVYVICIHDVESDKDTYQIVFENFDENKKLDHEILVTQKNKVREFKTLDAANKILSEMSIENYNVVTREWYNCMIVPSVFG